MELWPPSCTEPSDVLRRPLLAAFVTLNSVAPGDNFTSANEAGKLSLHSAAMPVSEVGVLHL